MKTEHSEFWKQCFLKALDIYTESRGDIRVYDSDGEPIFNDIFLYSTEFSNACVECLENV